MRKPHAKSKLKTLPEDAQARIADWCAQDSLESAVSRCASELQLATNRSSMSEFFAWWKLKQTFATANARTADFEELMKGEFPDATAEKIAASGQLYFTMLASNAENAEEFRAMEMLRLAKETATTNARIADAKIKQKDAQIRQKDADLALSSRRVVLLEDNAKKAKAALESVKSKGGLTPETLKQIEEAAGLL